MPAVLLLLASPLAAQIKLGEVSTRLNGTVSSGYSADFGNLTPSDHGWTVGGTGTLSGSFYSPNFLSFNVSPYLNQSRANSNFQSISNASGVDASASIFSGSQFPGSISYTKAYNSDGNYSVPGIANYVTHGNSDAFSINWSENLLKVPSLLAGFEMGNSAYTVYGTNDSGKNAFHSFHLNSGYQVAGFSMGAFYLAGSSHALIPEIATNQASTQTQSDNTAYGYNISHYLPLKGSFSATINRSGWNTNYLGLNTNGTIDTFTAIASVHPFTKVSFSGSANYSDNLSGQLYEAIIAAGGVVPELNTSEASHSLDLMALASYSPGANLQTTAFFERRTQYFLGETFGVKSFGGGANYSHKLLGGAFNASLNVTGNVADSNGEETLGISTNENYSNEIRGWLVTGSFGYSQNVQTLLVTYMNSYFNYSGNARRRWGRFNVGLGAGASRTALTEQAGTANSTENYNATVGYTRWFTASGGYSKSNGQALATGAGLVTVPVPNPVLPSDLVSLYGGSSYSFALSSTPVKKLLLTANYGKSTSNVVSNSISSANQNNQFGFLAQYQFRKMYFNSGFARMEQGFSGSGTPPEVISSFYIGVARWFNFF